MDSLDTTAVLKAVDTLTSDEMRTAVFVRPTVGEELTKPFAVSTKHSPAVEALSISKVWLGNDWVIPGHRHPLISEGGKEKLYIFHGPVILVVTIIINGEKFVYRLRERDMLVVPAGCWHSVKFFPGYETAGSFTVVASSPNPAVEWEENIDALLASTAPKKRQLPKWAKD